MILLIGYKVLVVEMIQLVGYKVLVVEWLNFIAITRFIFKSNLINIM